MDQVERKRVLEIMKTATTQSEIDSVFDKLFEIVTAMTMGKTKGDPELRSQILDLMQRIKQNVKSTHSENQIVLTYLDTLNSEKSVSTECISDIYNFYNSNVNGGDFQKKIDSLLHLCDGKMANVFDPAAIRQAMIQRVSTIAPTVDGAVEIIQETVQPHVSPVECPILLDDDVQNICVFIPQSTPLLNDLSKGDIDWIISNTFSAKRFGQNLKARIGHSVSLEAYKILLDKTYSEYPADPFTNLETIGCFVLGADPVSVKVTNNGIARLITGGNKIIGNPDIWFYTIYSMIKNGEIPWLADYEEMFRRQMVYRLLNSKAVLSMSGLANHVQLSGNLASALYFTLSQPLFIKDNTQSSYPIFSSSTQDMLALLSMVEYELPEKPRLMQYYEVVKTLGNLVNQVKDLHIEMFRTKHQCKVQNHMIINLDELTPAFAEYVKQNKWLHTYILLDSVDEAHLVGDTLEYNLSNLIQTEGVKTFSIPIDIMNIDSYFKPQSTQKIQNWPVSSMKTMSEYYKIQICPKTMRPYTFTPAKVHWKKNYTNIVTSHASFEASELFDSTPECRPSKLVFSGDKYYAEFVNQFGFYPTKNDFITYCFNKVRNGQYNIQTLPIINYTDGITRYNSVTQNTSPADFCKLHEASRDRERRVQMEQS